MKAFTLPSVDAQVTTLRGIDPKLNPDCLGKSTNMDTGVHLVVPRLGFISSNPHTESAALWSIMRNFWPRKGIFSECDSRIFGEGTTTVPITSSSLDRAWHEWDAGDFFIIEAYSGVDPHHPGVKEYPNHIGYPTAYARHVMIGKQNLTREFPLGIREALILTIVSPKRFIESDLIMRVPGTLVSADGEDANYGVLSTPAICSHPKSNVLKLFLNGDAISNRFAGSACGKLCPKP